MVSSSIARSSRLHQYQYPLPHQNFFQLPCKICCHTFYFLPRWRCSVPTTLRFCIWAFHFHNEMVVGNCCSTDYHALLDASRSVKKLLETRWYVVHPLPDKHFFIFLVLPEASGIGWRISQTLFSRDIKKLDFENLCQAKKERHLVVVLGLGSGEKKIYKTNFKIWKKCTHHHIFYFSQNFWICSKLLQKPNFR